MPSARLALTLTAAVVALAAARAAHGAGSPESAECRQALVALQVQEDKAIDRRRAAEGHAPAPASPEVEKARRLVAAACLGGTANPDRAARAAPAPVSVPPVRVAPAPLPVPVAPASPAASPPRPAPMPLSVTSCDAGGCWASDGTRLPRAGPLLVAPRGGWCSVQGTLLQCP